VGAYPGLRATAAGMSRVVPAAEPDPVSRPAYTAAFRAYQATAEALRLVTEIGVYLEIPQRMARGQRQPGSSLAP
jgi:hypothetical protein